MKKSKHKLKWILIIFIVLGTVSLTVRAEERVPILTVDGDEVVINVGETFDVSTTIFAYVDQKSLQWSIPETDTIYFVEKDLMFYALRAGEVSIEVMNDNQSMYTLFKIIVSENNLYEDGDFEHFQVGTTWTAMNQTINSWRLYTGNVQVKEGQLVNIIEMDREGKPSKVVHAKHDEIAYTNLYYDIPVIADGYYYIEIDIKGLNLTNNVYARLNVNEPTMTNTTPMKGTFDWTRFTSGVVEVTDQTLRVELYGANFQGEVWYDNLTVFRVEGSDYLNYDLNTSLVNLTVGSTYQINPTVDIISDIEFAYDYQIEDTQIAQVTDHGLIEALDVGITTLYVTDQQNQVTKSVFVIVGSPYTFTSQTFDYTVLEDQTLVEQLVDDDIDIYPYSNPLYGDYYLMDSKLVYTPHYNFNSYGNPEGDLLLDIFQIILFDETLGYQIIDVSVEVTPDTDHVEVIDFWHTTEKDQVLMGGYVEVFSKDIETFIPEQNQTTLKSFVLNDGINTYLDVKTERYQNITASLADGMMIGATEHDGQVEILYNGQTQQVKDRYFDVLSTIKYGIYYEYKPKAGFIGYDYFTILIDHNGIITEFDVTVYVSPTVSDFKFDEANFSGVYVVGNDSWIEETREAYVQGDPTITTWIDYYKDLFKIYSPTGVPANSRAKLEQLSILYQVTGNSYYADLTWDQLYEVIKDNTYPGGDGTKRSSWGKDSNGFLDAAMVTYSVAFAYNMIYETLDESQKIMVLRALYEEGFYYFERMSNVNVLLHGNNHNLLINGNLATAALAVMSFEGAIEMTTPDGIVSVDIKEMASKVVSQAYQYLQIAFVHYSPSGGFPEGPAYSYYGHKTIIGLMATLKNIYGSEGFDDIYDFGLNDVLGIKNYPEYVFYSTTPNYHTFYYNEGGYNIDQPGMLWYARVDQKYEPYTVTNKMAFENEIYTAISLLWYKPGMFESLSETVDMPYDQLLEVHEMATFRNRFNDDYATFSALKGFDPTSNLFTHKSLDSGTFEIVSYGEKFIENFSNENYSLSVPPGFWDYQAGRWQYYRKQPQGHNTIVFNPSDHPNLQQDPNEKAGFIEFESNDAIGYGILDLSKVYHMDVNHYYRGMLFDRSNNSILIQDEFELRKQSEFYWAAHTAGSVEIINDKLASITINHKKLYVVIESEMGSFTYDFAQPLPGTQGLFYNLNNDSINKLIIHETDVTQGVLSVRFIPSLEEVKVKESFDIVTLSKWQEYVVDVNEKNQITANDIQFSAVTGNKYRYEFNPNKYTYQVRLDPSEQFVPRLNVDYDAEKYDLNINYADHLTGLTTVELIDKTTLASQIYTYQFITDVFVDPIVEMIKHDVLSVESENETAIHLIDDDRSTVFSALDFETVVFSFAEVKRITNISLRFNGGATYQYYFDVYAGHTLEEMELVYFGGQSNYLIGDEYISLGDINAKYIKIVFKGNTYNHEIGLSRVNFYDNQLINVNDEIDDNSTQNNGNTWLIIGLSVAGSTLVIATGFIIYKKRMRVM